MALVTVLSVMNGFEKDLENNILGLMPQALVTSPQGSVNPQQLPASEVQKLQGVTRVAPLTTGDVVLQSARSVAVGVMLGVNPDEADPLTPYLVNVKQQQLQPGQYNIIIGEQLAGQLGVKRGDSLRVMVPSASQFTPMGRIPSQRLFTLIGTFHANSEVDGYQLLVNQQDASRLMRYPAGNITGWRLFRSSRWRSIPSANRRCRRARSGKTGAIARASCSRRCVWRKHDGAAAQPDRGGGGV